MVIGIAGPYSADTSEQRNKNLDVLNRAAAQLLDKGHIPLIGVNAALPVVSFIDKTERYKAIMKISLAMIDRCEALLLLGESPGANKEKELIVSKGLPVYYRLENIPDNK